LFEPASGVCKLIFIINWIVRDKKYNNVYKHKHIRSLKIRNTQNDSDFVFVFNRYSDRCNWQLWAVVLLMASFTWMGKQKKIISNNKDTAALRLSRKLGSQNCGTVQYHIYCNILKFNILIFKVTS
jgi:hypothetical protein